LKALQKHTFTFLVTIQVQNSRKSFFPIFYFSTIRQISFLLRKRQWLRYMIWWLKWNWWRSQS